MDTDAETDADHKHIRSHNRLQRSGKLEARILSGDVLYITFNIQKIAKKKRERNNVGNLLYPCFCHLFCLSCLLLFVTG